MLVLEVELPLVFIEVLVIIEVLVKVLQQKY